MASLTYDEIYKISEELQQLHGAQLQSVLYKAPTRYFLDFRVPGHNRWLILDLTPSEPLFFSMAQEDLKEKIKKGSKQTPVSNFLKAHFVNRRLHALEIAQKPNRTVRMIFDPEGTVVLTFKCFPHGHEIKLEAGEKEVIFPRRDQDPENVAFVEPEKVISWEFNDLIAQDHSKPAAGGQKLVEPYHLKLMKKLERAIQAIDEGFGKGRVQNEQKIRLLEHEADELKESSGNIGGRLDSIYEEIKKLRRKSEQTLQRRKDLEGQLEKLRGLSPQEAQATTPPLGGQGSGSKQRKKIFSGTRVILDSQWELWVGRNAWQNEDLLKLCNPHDLWIHLRDYPGAHGAIRGPKKAEPPPKHLDFACQIVALLSQSKKKPFREGEFLDFIVTQRKFVKKPKGAAPGLVTVEREKVRRVAFKPVKFEVV
jgi:predicted ribosome quality control (RQC) complex YloA/Tae2 family protein